MFWDCSGCSDWKYFHCVQPFRQQRDVAGLLDMITENHGVGGSIPSLGTTVHI